MQNVAPAFIGAATNPAPGMDAGSPLQHYCTAHLSLVKYGEQRTGTCIGALMGWMLTASDPRDNAEAQCASKALEVSIQIITAFIVEAKDTDEEHLAALGLIMSIFMEDMVACTTLHLMSRRVVNTVQAGLAHALAPQNALSLVA